MGGQKNYEVLKYKGTAFAGAGACGKESGSYNGRATRKESGTG